MMRTLLTPSLLLATIAAHAQFGQLDPSYGTDGMVVLNYFENPWGASPKEMHVLADGGTLSIGTMTLPNRLILVKQLLDGELDTAFGDNGLLNTGIETGLYNEVRTDIMADGRLVIGQGSTVQDEQRPVVHRLLGNGSPDPGFGGNGVAIPDLAMPGDLSLGAVVTLPDGAVLIAGRSIELNAAYVAKLDASGDLDVTFGDDGLVILDPFDQPEWLSDMDVGPDGRITVAGHVFTSTSRKALLFHLLADGSLDEGFGDDGMALITFGPDDLEGQHVRVLASGRILVGGVAEVASNSRPMVFRLLADGSVDAGFGTDGFTIFSDISSGDIEAMCVQPDERILVAGGMFDGNGTSMMMLRMDIDGQRDESFGTNGVVMTEFTTPSGDGAIKSVRIGTDGKIYALGVKGTTFVGENRHVSLRYGSGIAARIGEQRKLELVVRPNPADDRIWIDGLEDGRYGITILDPAGRVLLRSRRTTSGPVDISTLPEGIFLLQVQGEEGVGTIHFVK